MGTWRSMYEGTTDYMSAADVDDETGMVTLTIKTARPQDVEGERGKQSRPVIHWHEDVKPWIVNKTNIILLEKIFGDDPGNAIDKKVSIRWDPTVKRSGETVGGLRVCGAPGMRPMVVKVKHPKKAAKEFRLVDTAPKQPAVDPAEAREKFLAYAASKGVTREQVDAFLSTHGTTLAEQSVENLRALAKDLDKIKQHAAQAGSDDGSGESGEWSDAGGGDG